jgi:hypothetical protein
VLLPDNGIGQTEEAMTHGTLTQLISRSAIQVVACCFALGGTGAAWAGDVTTKMLPRIDTYKKQAVAWAADPQILKAVKESNASGPIAGMGNAKWRDLKESDPNVKGLVTMPRASS